MRRKTTIAHARGCEGSLPLDRWRVGHFASTQILQPVWRCRLVSWATKRRRRVDCLVNTCSVEGASVFTGDWKCIVRRWKRRAAARAAVCRGGLWLWLLWENAPDNVASDMSVSGK